MHRQARSFAVPLAISSHDGQCDRVLPPFVQVKPLDGPREQTMFDTHGDLPETFPEAY